MIRNRISRPQSERLTDRLSNPFRFRAVRRRGRLHLSLGTGSVAVALTWLAVLVVGTLAFLRTSWTTVPLVEHPGSLRPDAGSPGSSRPPGPEPVVAGPVIVGSRGAEPVGAERVVARSANGPAVIKVSPRTPDNALSPRTAGLNYLVLGSFSRLEDARAFQHRVASLGILASVEPALAGWSRSGFCVVDERGFELPAQQRELDRAIARLKSARIDARPYRWRGDSLASSR